MSVGAQASSFVVMADINGRYGSVGYHPRVGHAIERIIQLKPDFVILAGDLVAGQQLPPLKPERLRAMWQAFESVVGAPLRDNGIEVVATAGNHDASAYPKFSLDRRAFADYWSALKPAGRILPSSNYPWYFATALDDSLVISLYASVPETLPSTQTQFLRDVLAENATKYDRILVVAHLPIFPISQGRQREVLDAGSLQPLLASYEVDWFISGHHHAFYAGQVRAAPVHLASAALGGNRRKWLGSDSLSNFGFIHVDERGMVAFYTDPEFEPDSPRGIPDQIGALRLRSDIVSGISTSKPANSAITAMEQE